MDKTEHACSCEADLRILCGALLEIRNRLMSHPMWADLTEEEELIVGGDTAELCYLVRVADEALSESGADK